MGAIVGLGLGCFHGLMAALYRAIAYDSFWRKPGDDVFKCFRVAARQHAIGGGAAHCLTVIDGQDYRIVSAAGRNKRFQMGLIARSVHVAPKSDRTRHVTGGECPGKLTGRRVVRRHGKNNPAAVDYGFWHAVLWPCAKLDALDRR